MRLGLEVNSSITFWLTKWSIVLHLPYIRIGFIHDHFADDSKWIGVKIEIPNEISFENYDYGSIFKFRLLGFGIEITKLYL